MLLARCAALGVMWSVFLPAIAHAAPPQLLEDNNRAAAAVANSITIPAVDTEHSMSAYAGRGRSVDRMSGAATTLLILELPTAIEELVPKLELAGLKPLEYRGIRPPADVLSGGDPLSSTTLTTQDGEAVLADNIVYQPHRTPIAEQAAEYTALYGQSASDTYGSGITMVVVAGFVDEEALGPLR
ncbi:MAG: hypothetical protein JWN72_1286, partial [Thermoleophilia bacterium]|nr:hypothetical protein [Thermoleophilia bacterium]